MQFNLNIESFNVNNTTKGNSDFEKYDIDVELNELSNSDNTCMLKYGFVFSSNPKGTRLSIEGIITLNGNSGEFEKIYEKDEQNIPHILRQSYHELYPVLFMITKSMNIPCPPYEISKTMDLSKNIESNEQNEAIPLESDSESITMEDVKEEVLTGYESMSTEELTKLQIELSKELSENPSEETKKKLDDLSTTLNKKINESIISSKM